MSDEEQHEKLANRLWDELIVLSDHNPFEDTYSISPDVSKVELLQQWKDLIHDFQLAMERGDTW